MIILGIETSCDETAASIIKVSSKNGVEVLSNIVSSQIEIHKKYGGVVPEVAAREHILNILPVVNEALEKAKIKKADAGKIISAIAVTEGPGLVTSLLVGVETARILSYVWNKPLIAVNHIEGHIYANFISQKEKDIKFPAVIMTVSGGHTMLVLMEGHGKLKVIGDTRDDAAGEAFDKAAKLLDIGYPDGPAIASSASKFQDLNQEDRQLSSSKLKFPRPMIYHSNFEFSFSGLKTALLTEFKKDKNAKKRINEYAYEVQEAITDVLVYKTIKAGIKYKAKTIMLAGGVSANEVLREKFQKEVKEKTDAKFFMPDLMYTTDNAPMIATAGYFKAKLGKYTDWKTVKAKCVNIF